MNSDRSVVLDVHLHVGTELAIYKQNRNGSLFIWLTMQVTVNPFAFTFHWLPINNISNLNIKV